MLPPGWFALAFACWLMAPQGVEPVPPTPYDRVVELELSADDERLIEDRGPTQIVEYEALFSGTLHVWTESELDGFLRVEDAVEMRVLGEDDSSGGGATPYLALAVEPGQLLAILVAGEAPGALELHLAASLETDATRAASASALQSRSKLRRPLAPEAVGAARQSLAMAAEALARTPGVNWSELAMAARRSLAEELTDLGDPVLARALQRSVLECMERTRPTDHPSVLSAAHDLALSLFQLGDLSEARSLREHLLEVRERTCPEDHPHLISARQSLAISLSRSGEFTRARALEESVLAARARTCPEDHPLLLRARTNLANTLHSLGDLAGARALRENVVKSRERTLPEDHPDLLSARHNLANSLDAMGNDAGARVLRESVLAARERTLPEDHSDLLSARGNLASSLDAMGDHAGARALRESVLAGRERTLPGEHTDVLSARGNLAKSLFKLGDHAAARAHMESVVAACERSLPVDHPRLVGARHELGRLLHAVGELAAAKAQLEQVLASCERTRPADHPSLLTTRANLALTLVALDDLDPAREQFALLVLGMRKRVLDTIALAPREALQVVASEDNRLSEVLFACHSLEEDAAAPGATASERKRDAFELVETMRLVTGESARSLHLQGKDSELAPILEAARVARTALSDLLIGDGSELPSPDSRLAELTRLSFERDRLEREASQLLATRRVVARSVDSLDLAAALGPGDVAVGYRRIAVGVQNPLTHAMEPGTDHMVAHVLRPGGGLTYLDLGPAAELEELGRAWRAALGAPLTRGTAVVGEADDSEARLGAQLRARILDPVIALADAGTQRLFVCADAMVYLVPLDALPLDEQGAARVGDLYSVVNEVSFARLLAKGSPAQDAGAQGEPALLVLGGVDYDAAGSAPQGLSAASAPIDEADSAPEIDATRGGLPERFGKLLQSRYEAEAVADLFEESFERAPGLLTREETTKAALFEAAPGVRFLHLATHGWFAPESVRSIEDAAPEGVSFARMGLAERVAGLAPMTLCGLALAGANRGRDSLGRVTGILTAEELCSLDLSQCDLAVLSACETNVGIRRAGQGIQSLQAALYAAGARTSITSLWKVDDAATRRLFEVFYTGLWIEKLPKGEALWKAKRVLRDEGHPPAHWAAWVLTGDPD